MKSERKLNLTERAEDVREKHPVVLFALDDIKQHFEENLQVIRSQFETAEYLLENDLKRACEDVWHAQIVFIASALDFYMHELTKYGLCQIFERNWEGTEKYNNINVKMVYVDRVINNEEDENWFLEYVNSAYAHVTMISVDSMKEQLNLLGIDWKGIADKVFYQEGALEKPEDQFKQILNTLFRRRNAIAHQLDREHADALFKPIDRKTVETFIDNVQKLVEAIHEKAEEK